MTKVLHIINCRAIVLHAVTSYRCLVFQVYVIHQVKSMLWFNRLQIEESTKPVRLSQQLQNPVTNNYKPVANHTYNVRKTIHYCFFPFVFIDNITCTQFIVICLSPKNNVLWTSLLSVLFVDYPGYGLAFLHVCSYSWK